MTGQKMTIRAYADEDEAQVVSLWRAVFGGESERNDPHAVIHRKLAVQRDLFVVGVLDGELVATALAGFDGHRGWVYRVAVDPRHQRRGYGRAIMSEIEARLRALGCPKLNLQVRGSNRTAARFYERLGYSVEDRVSMGRVL